nr:phosphatidylglycerol lysyltransferase domain-containing protein [uncultured Peptostreptococcus sp.]
MEFKEINIDAKPILDKYFDLVDYEACEYCFNTLYMWQHAYKTHYHIGDGFAILVGEHNGEIFSILPLAPKNKIKEAIEFAINFFDDGKHKIYFRGIDLNVVEILKKLYPDRFEYIEERDIFDYVYDAEKLRTVKGRKLSGKRNHLNYFKREYEARVERRLLDVDDFSDCLNLLKEWSTSKDGDQEFEDSIDDEYIGIKKLLDNYQSLKDRLKIYGIFIDGKLEAFSMGEKINDEMALVHIEKANAEIRGLYPYINQMFISDIFPDVKWVNREEDMGIEGLRKAKMSYYPERFVEKYTVRAI